MTHGYLDGTRVKSTVTMHEFLDAIRSTRKVAIFKRQGHFRDVE